ncbi:LOW QUALITY PROTEIN: pre-piRNA 3'-exonuclease trimmer-like [Portunus trituberculatus]|uniref:LOW QUALITY PROTEIN: pre-piRNA 3'-exonuclease trimmer-like n=1 Tax=Portunus trituberculatus TaxID=210409 RepID=UPI001E1CFDB8|nr:LOW QUALITY PROTEIN: pre-piRNA 3'-exonuclease trimmer-like [Portunus trituberculatus]
MVDVTSTNFSSVLPLIVEEARSCSFLALDTEFTGLLADSAFRNNLFDDGPQRYHKLSANLRRFSVVQLGLALFTGVPDQNAYSVTSYNFYLRPHSCGSSDPIIACQTSSLEFLQKYNFDFNKWLYEGVPYMNRDEIDDLRTELTDLFSGKKASHMSYEVERHFRCVGDGWLEWRMARHTLSGVEDIHSQATLLAALHTSFLELWATLQDGLIVVKKVSNNERARLEEEDPNRTQLIDGIIERNKGFTSLFQVLVELQKPVVVHNGLLDLLLIYKQFHKRLPASYDLFKSEVHRLFPFIYDTKFVAEELKYKHKEDTFVSRALSKTNLGDLATAMRGDLPVLYLPKLHHTTPGNKYTQEGATLHEAGYDALLTGFCFLRMCHLAAMVQLHQTQHQRPLSPREHLSTLRPYANKMHLQRSAVPFMSLAGADPRTKRPPWLVVQGRGGAMRASPGLVSAALAKYGQLDVQPLNNNSVLVAMSSWRSVTEILANLSSEGPLKAQVYTRLRHSTLGRSVVWSGAVLSTGLCAWLVYRSFRKSSP